MCERGEVCVCVCVCVCVRGVKCVCVSVIRVNNCTFSQHSCYVLRISALINI